MARKNQQLINYHTSGKTVMPSGSNVHYGEIVVRHNAEKPELLIKVGENAFGVFEASGAVVERINSAVTIANNTLMSEISDLESALTQHVSDFTAYKETADATFATKTELSNAKSALTEDYTNKIANAKSEVYTSATTFATNAVNTAKGELTNLINGVDSKVGDLDKKVDAVSAYVETTYATKAELQGAEGDIATAIETAKNEAIGAASSYTDTQIENVAKKYTDTKISEVNNTIATTNSDVNTLSASVVNNYATKVELSAATEQIGSDINTAKAEVYSSGKTYTDNAKASAITSANSYTDTKVQTLSETVTGLINGVSSDVDDLDKKVDAVSAYVETTYATKAELQSAQGDIATDIETAKTAAITSANSYTDTQIENVAKKYTDTKIGEVNNSIKTLDSKVDTFSAATEEAINGLSEDLTDLINTQIATAYRYMGSCTWEELQTKEKTNGAVYNVTDLVTLDGEVYQPGTNFAWSEKESKWEALGGSVDLTPYATTEYVNKQIGESNNSVAGVSAKVDELSAATKTLSGNIVTYVDSTFLTKETFNTEKAGIESAYTSAINTAKEAAIGAASSYTDTKVNSAVTIFNNSIATTNSNVNTLSAATETIKATANSAVQSASIVDADDCKVEVTKEGTELKFDFSNMIIDCGDF